jgi:hypothetical protein
MALSQEEQPSEFVVYHKQHNGPYDRNPWVEDVYHKRGCSVLNRINYGNRGFIRDVKPGDKVSWVGGKGCRVYGATPKDAANSIKPDEMGLSF